MTTKELFDRVAQEMAEKMPKDLIKSIAETAIRDSLAALSHNYNQNSLRDLVDKAVRARVEEMLRTTYKAEVDEAAQRLALRAVAELVRDRR